MKLLDTFRYSAPFVYPEDIHRISTWFRIAFGLTAPWGSPDRWEDEYESWKEFAELALHNYLGCDHYTVQDAARRVVAIEESRIALVYPGVQYE